MRKKDFKQIIRWFDQVKEQSEKDCIKFYEKKDRPYYEELFEHDEPYHYSHPEYKYHIGIDNANNYLTLNIDLDNINTNISVQSSFNILKKNAKYRFIKLINKFANMM